MRFQIKESMINSRGSALVNAIVVAAVVATISGIIMTQTITTDRSSRAPRIRSSMAVMQGRVQALASQFTSYNCPIQNNIGSCTANQNIYQTLQDNITGAKCPGSGSCGVHVTGVTFDPSQMLFEANIVYDGTEVSIAPIKIQYRIPTEVLAQQASFLCPNVTPIFKGYNPDGSINCVGFPGCSGGLSLNNQGTFISSLNVATLTPSCNVLGSTLACANTEYMSNYSWIGTGFTKNCAPRLDPFSAMAYTPGAATGAPAIINQQFTATTTSTTTSSTTTSTTLSGCASAADPFTWVSWNACSSSAPPGNPTCYGESGYPASFHGTNYPATTVSVAITLSWHGMTTVCNYSSYLPAGGSTGGVGGGCSPSIPGIAAQSVDFFNTSPGPGPGGLNILGPGPGYDPTCVPPPPPSPPTTVPTSFTPTAWNCYDGYAGGPGACNTGVAIVDDSAESGTNPGSAQISLTWNGSNGDYNQRCTCTSGTLTVVSTQCSSNLAYYVCSGGMTALPSCSYGQAVGGNPDIDAGHFCYYDPSLGVHGTWVCPAHLHPVNTPAQTYPCP